MKDSVKNSAKNSPKKSGKEEQKSIDDEFIIPPVEMERSKTAITTIIPEEGRNSPKKALSPKK